MTERRLLKTSHSDEVRLTGRVLPAGTGAPTTKGNWISAVARNGAGDYTLTVKTEYKGLLTRQVAIEVSLHTNGGADWRVVSADVSGATFKLFTRNSAGTLADLASDVDNYIAVSLTGKWSDALDGSGVT